MPPKRVTEEQRQSMLANAGIVPDAPDSWSVDLPAFGTLQSKLLTYARDSLNPQARCDAAGAAHVSTVFVFNMFRNNGQKVAWPDLLEPSNRVVVIQFKDLGQSSERAVAEFLLWNLIGFIEAMDPARCAVSWCSTRPTSCPSTVAHWWKSSSAHVKTVPATWGPAAGPKAANGKRWWSPCIAASWPISHSSKRSAAVALLSALHLLTLQSDQAAFKWVN
jgi:hypothetical protein